MFGIKTLIELFDECQIENLVAALRFKPEKIVFIGFKETMKNKRIEAVKHFLQMRGLDIVIEIAIVGRYEYASIVEKLNNVLDTNEDCCFDLTGGKELVLTAMGEVSAARDVPMFQFNVRTGRFIEVKNCENLSLPEPAAILINECVALYGGAVVYDDINDYNWNLTDDFKKDIRTIWSICKVDCRDWNKQANAFGSFDKYGTVSNLAVLANAKEIKETRRDATIYLNKRIIKSLLDKHLIFDFDYKDDIVTYRYKNEQVRQCITKAGNILELYAYMTAMEISAENPGFYDDVDVGVHVDWDGVIHDGTTKERDTKNEIDIMLMKDLVPVFISCKNGEAHKEALYELNIVAEHFGGTYAKRILLTTYVNPDDESRKYLKQRATDMGITVLDDVDKMTEEEFKAEFMKNTK